MKRIAPLLLLLPVLTALMLFAVSSSVLASDDDHQERYCPAHRAAQQGYGAFEEFHRLVASVWHEAWPARDYDALLAAGPHFVKSYGGVEILEPEFKSPTKAKRFEVKRQELKAAIDEYAAAAARGDKEKVYELMPGLHDAFEETAATLLPTEYPQLTGLLTVSETILRHHLPKSNTDGIVGSTETLVLQVGALNQETIPDDLQYFKADLLKQFAALKAKVREAKKCCDVSDMATYKSRLEELHTMVSDMIAQYL